MYNTVSLVSNENGKRESSHQKRGMFGQGLEGYSRDPGFDQNTVRDSGKRKIS